MQGGGRWPGAGARQAVRRRSSTMPCILTSRSRPHALAHLPLRWIVPACVVLAIVCATTLAAIAWSGAGAAWQALAAIGAATFATGTLVCCATLLLRFARWRHILQRQGHVLPDGFSLRVYLAGVALSASPGKLGETLRSALLLPRGVPLAQSIAAFVADRLSDLIGVALLGAVAGMAAGQRQPVLEVIALLALVGPAWLAQRLRSGWTLQPGAWQRAPAWLQRLARRAAAPALAWAQRWTPSPVGAYAVVALAVYGLQALVFASYVNRLAPGTGIAACVAVYANATLIGAATLLPGGLGAMESALVLQLHGLGLPLPQAIAATLAARVSTLWVGWGIGFAALLSFARYLPGASEQTANQAAS